jgi:hypothetical protein
MTELFQNSQSTDEENLHSAAAPNEDAQSAAALPASSSAPDTPESSCPPETEGSAPKKIDGAGAPLTINVQSSPAENVDSHQPNEVCGPVTPLPPSPQSRSVMDDLHADTKRIIARRTLLPDSVCALLAFWVTCTWFQAVLTIYPCLVIVGEAHEAMLILHVLFDLCYAPTLLAGLKRTDLTDLRGNQTLLISAPYIDNRTAALLGNFTNRHCMMVQQGSPHYGSNSKAVYIGESPAIKRILHSISVDATIPARADGPVWGPPKLGNVYVVRERMLEYRDRNLDKVRPLDFNPSGLSLEATVIANALGSCIVDSPQLQMQLVALLRPQDQQQIADRSDCDEALVLGAALTLCHQDKGEIFVREIAVEFNRVLVARGEKRQLSPEKVGHMLKKVGLFTRRLSHAGNGLILDQATRIRLHEVATAYRGEDSIQEEENLHCALCEKNQVLGEVV